MFVKTAPLLSALAHSFRGSGRTGGLVCGECLATEGSKARAKFNLIGKKIQSLLILAIVLSDLWVRNVSQLFTSGVISH